MTDILYEQRGTVAWITINRPDKMNSFRGQTCDEIIKALNKAGYDREVGCIVLAGAGDRAFCTGGDQSAHNGNYDGRGTIGLPMEELHTAIRDVPKPVIARVQGFAIGGGIGFFFGLINGGLIAFLKLPPFIVTLGALTAVRGVARLIGDDKTVFNPELPFAFIGNDSILGVPWLVVIATAVIIGSWFILRRTVLGLHIYSVGSNPEAARLSGIKVWKVLLTVYALSGLLAGLGAVMTSSRLMAANGLQLGQSYELDAIAAVILGGTSFVGGVGTIVGTLIGALIIAVLTNGLVLVGVSDIWQYIIKGLVIIGAVALDRYRQAGART